MTWAIFDQEHPRAIAEIITGSDRVAAIVGATLLDATLRRTLQERFREENDIGPKLMKPSGALGNAGPKIDVLYLLGAFGKPTRNTLYGLSETRNYFAHNLESSFDATNPKLIEALGKLVLHEGRTVYPHHIYDQDSDIEIGPITTNRDRFLVNLRLSLIALMRDRMSHHTWTNLPRTEAELRELRGEPTP